MKRFIWMWTVAGLLIAGCSRNIDYSQRDPGYDPSSEQYGQYQFQPVRAVTDLWIYSTEKDLYSFTFLFDESMFLDYQVDWSNQNVIHRNREGILGTIASPFEFSNPVSSGEPAELTVRYQLAEDFQNPILEELMIHSVRTTENHRIKYQLEGDTTPTETNSSFVRLKTNLTPSFERVDQFTLIREQRSNDRTELCGALPSRPSRTLLCVVRQEDPDRYIPIGNRMFRKPISYQIDADYFDRVSKKNVRAVYEIF